MLCSCKLTFRSCCCCWARVALATCNLLRTLRVVCCGACCGPLAGCCRVRCCARFKEFVWLERESVCVCLSVEIRLTSNRNLARSLARLLRVKQRKDAAANTHAHTKLRRASRLDRGLGSNHYTAARFKFTLSCVRIVQRPPTFSASLVQVKVERVACEKLRMRARTYTCSRSRHKCAVKCAKTLRAAQNSFRFVDFIFAHTHTHITMLQNAFESRKAVCVCVRRTCVWMHDRASSSSGSCVCVQTTLASASLDCARSPQRSHFLWLLANDACAQNGSPATLDKCKKPPLWLCSTSGDFQISRTFSRDARHRCVARARLSHETRSHANGADARRASGEHVHCALCSSVL